jgi:putative membrane protein
MGKDSLEIALIKYNKKTWSKSALLGFFIGLAVIVPGISGSTVAIIFKLYDQFLYAVGNLFKKFKKCFAFLLPIGIGMVLGVLLGFISVKKLLDIIPFAVVCLFAGLMCGAFPAVNDEIKGAEKNAKRITLFAVGLLIPVALGCVSAWLASGESVTADTFAKVEWWHAVLGLLIGYVVGVTQIVPGLSASAFLMAVGWFGSIMESVSLTYWKSNPAVFLVYAGLGIGFLLGLFTFSKFLTYLFGKARYTAYSMIVGLSLGSILSMFCNGDIVAVYTVWTKSGIVWLDLLLGVGLFAIGAFAAYKLVQYQRKKDAEEASKNA